MSTESILLIDDNSKKLGHINLVLDEILKPHGVRVNAWNPVQCDKNPAQIIKNYLKFNPVMVVTNYDLSSDGLNGFYGPTIVQWCKSQLVPVGEYSQTKKFGYLEQPNLFDISVPSDQNIAPTHIASIVDGFLSIRNFIESNQGMFENKLSLSKIISQMLGREHLHLQFNQYIESIDKVNNNIILYMNGTKKVAAKKLQTISSYIIGHLLLNSILKYPGPIISEQALCSYLSIANDNYDNLKRIFKTAVYQGPFSSIGRYYWCEDIDQIILESGKTFLEEFEGNGDFNRAVLKKLGGEFKPFQCNQCNGKYGGYFCPFTKKTVCELESCSSFSAGWIPRGADICRIERDFFDSWSTLLYK